MFYFLFLKDVNLNAEEIKKPKENGDIVKDSKVIKNKEEKDDEDYKNEEDKKDDDDDEEEILRVVPKGHNILPGGRKKQRRLNALDLSSGDDDNGSDEDFKGSRYFT